MQPDPVDSKNMISADDRGWDEQDQYNSDKYKDIHLLFKNLDLLRIQHDYLWPQNAADIILSVGVDTDDVFPIIRVPIVRFSMNGVQTRGSHSNMEKNVPTTGDLVGCAGDESSALFAVPTSLHQQFLLNNPGAEGTDVRRSNHAPTIISSTEENCVPLHQLFINQLQDKRDHFCGKKYLSPKVGNQLEAKHKPIQMMSLDSKNFGDTSDGLNKSVVPKSMVGMTVMSAFFPAMPESESPDPGTFHKYLFGEWIRTSTKPSCPVLKPRFNRSAMKKTSGSITANPRPGDKGFVLYSSYAKGNRVKKNIFVISSTGNGGSSSEGTGSTLTGGNNHHRETDEAYNDMPLVILDNMAEANCTGNFNVLSNLHIGPQNVVLVAANNGEMETFMSGSVHQANFELTDVHYCPDLGNRIIVSGSILDNDDYGYEFGRGKFTVKDLKTGRIVGEGRLVNGNYIVDYLKIPHDRTRVPEQPGLVTTVWNAVCSALHRLGLKY